jgi:diguanylate cyclase (GGDEF)-like protein
VASVDLRAAYADQQRHAARTTTSIGAIVALVAFPAWAIFDQLVLPAQAATFLRLRIGFEAAIVVGWLALRSRRVGGRWPEQSSFVLLALPLLAISWMIPRAGDQLEPYLLGLSLVIFASAFLIVWRWQLTVLLVGLTALALSTSYLTAPIDPAAQQIATVVFYLATAGAIAVAAQLYRHQIGWQRFVIEAALDEERVRNAALVDELDQITREDALTGVGNRRAWEQRTVNELLRATRNGGPVSVILCDLDSFKSVNDSFGHAAGDRVLRAAAALLTNRVRATDFVVRFGGDEFCVLCPDTGLLEARALALEIAEVARATRWPDGAHVTFSIGVAEARPGDVDPDEVLHRADLALYAAKATRDTVQIR